MGAVERVGVVGGGIMGAGIAEVSARAGTDVVLVEVDDTRAADARQRIATSLERAAARGKLEGAPDDVLARISATAAYEALADRQLVVEAVVEDAAEKRAVFGRLDEVVADPDAIFASNTSSLPITALAAATGRPHRVLGLHFFNPVPVMRLVELVPAIGTDETAVAAAEAFAREQLGKQVIRSADRAGFVVNTLLVPYLLSAIRLLEAGHATAEDIDTGMVEGCAHPMGPFALADLIGLDTTKAIAEALYEEHREPLYAPPPLLSRLVEAGHLGRKSGRGFYSYD